MKIALVDLLSEADAIYDQEDDKWVPKENGSALYVLAADRRYCPNGLYADELVEREGCLFLEFSDDSRIAKAFGEE